MTYPIAHSIGLDAANRQMCSAGRSACDEDDANLAATLLNRYFPLCAGHPGISPEACGCGKCCPQAILERQGLLFKESAGRAAVRAATSHPQ